MMLRTIVFFFFFISLFSFSQEESENCLPPSKKVQKLLKEAKNAKDIRTAVDYYNKAIELDDENAYPYFEYANYAYNNALKFYEKYPRPEKGDKSLKKAEEMFLNTLDVCNDFHADCFYYLGVINFAQDDKKEAIKWFKKFKEYKHSDPERYPADYSTKINDVNEVLSDLEDELVVKSQKVPFEPKLVKKVSTADQEYFPMISPDNELMFFTRKLNRQNLGDIVSNVVEEITYAKRASIFDEFTVGEPLPHPFNDGTFQSYGAATLSVDNKEMIVCACKKEEVYGQPYMNCDLYSTIYTKTEKGPTGYEWTPLKNLGEKINTPNGWEAQPSLSADGKTLFFTANRPGTRDNDIFIARRNDKGEWVDVRPFDEINTEGKDKSPFLHQDSETLYFVSEVTKDRKGVGGLDIFYMRKENGKWTKPKNIGYPINSESDELGLFVSIDGKLAYFSSRDKGNWNIYSFELYEEARPQNVAIIKGELDGENIDSATIEILYEGTDEVTKVKINGNDGKYAAIVKTDTPGDVMVTVKKKGYAFDSKIIKKEELSAVKPEEEKRKEVKIEAGTLAVKKLKLGEPYTINDILFPTNSAELSRRTRFILKGFAKFLKENPSVKVVIQGHTDDVGDDEKNLSLSEKRAQNVKNYLISLGVEKQRLSAKGYGETKPKVPNTSEKNRAQNRRTEFVIIGM